MVGPSSMPPTTSRTHAPAATTTTRACHSSSDARTRTPSPEASTVNDAGPTPKRTSAPWAAARSCSEATVAAARQRPASGWNRTSSSKRMPGQRLAAADGRSTSRATPSPMSAAAIDSTTAAGPWSIPPVSSSRVRPASASSSRQSGSASFAMRT